MILKQGISKERLVRILKKTTSESYEFVAVQGTKGGLFNIVASRKMWDKKLGDLFNHQSKIVEGEEVMAKAKKSKKGKSAKKVDFGSLSPKDLIRAANNEDTEKGGVSEVEARLKRIQGIYSVYNPDDSFKAKGDTIDLNPKALIAAWYDEDTSEEAEEMVTTWLSIEQKVRDVVATLVE